MTSLAIASSDLCEAYRSVAPVHVRITSRCRWLHVKNNCGGGARNFSHAHRSAAAPPPGPPLIQSMRWEISMNLLPMRRDVEKSVVSAVKRLGRRVVGRRSRPRYEGCAGEGKGGTKTVWPASLHRLTLGDLNEPQTYPLDKVTWPSSLKELSFERGFNRNIDDVTWPASLEQMYMGINFNRSIDGIEWPASLRRLEFGHSFDRPIDKVVWPTSLKALMFGYQFNKPIDGVVWPAALEELTFGRKFDQRVDGIVWPASLKEVQLWSRRVEL